jgi:signal peptidase II
MQSVPKNTRFMVYTVVTAVVVVVDQLTKLAAVRWLAGEGTRLWLGGSFRLQYVENRGAFLSLGASLPDAVRTGIFVVAVLAILVIISVYILKGKQVARGELWAASLFTSGGLGNLIDRIIFGYVRDFANVGFGPVRTGVFNVADMAITAGAVVLLIHVFRSRSGD